MQGVTKVESRGGGVRRVSYTLIQMPNAATQTYDVKISSRATEEFNPDLAILLTDGDVYGMTLKDAMDKLIICDDCLIFKTSEPAFIKRHGTRYERLEANLFNLMNQDFLPEAPQEYWLWFHDMC